jgi:hypothetical protein
LCNKNFMRFPEITKLVTTYYNKLKLKKKAIITNL